MCDLSKPLMMCTLGDFAEAVAMALRGETNIASQPKKLRKGLDGIRAIFNCSDYKARQILHSGIIEDAIIHLGTRSFVTDEDKALHLYSINK